MVAPEINVGLDLTPALNRRFSKNLAKEIDARLLFKDLRYPNRRQNWFNLHSSIRISEDMYCTGMAYSIQRLLKQLLPQYMTAHKGSCSQLIKTL